MIRGMTNLKGAKPTPLAACAGQGNARTNSSAHRSGTEVCFGRKLSASLPIWRFTLLIEISKYSTWSEPLVSSFQRSRLISYYSLTQGSPRAGKFAIPTPRTCPTSSTHQAKSRDGSHPRVPMWTNSKHTWLKIPENQRGRSMPHTCSSSTGTVGGLAAGRNPPLRGRRRKL